ncbi:MAG: glycerate dehydrogenase, partial [Opitutaceae bacterium]
MSESAWATVMPAPERRELHRLLDVVDVIHDPATASRRNPDAWSDVEVIVGGWGVPPLDAAFLARVPALRAVFFTAGSVKGFVTDALWERGVRVTSAALANAQPVAEFTCAQIVLSLKRVWPRVFAWRDQRIYEQDDALAPGACDATVGLLAL